MRRINIFIGCWGCDEYVYSLSEESARSSVEGCHRFGDPSQDQYALGNVWSSADSEIGWHIKKRKVNASPIDTIVCGDGTGGHVVWKCPHCNRFHSEDIVQDLPALFLCLCKGTVHFMVDASLTNSDE